MFRRLSATKALPALALSLAANQKCLQSRGGNQRGGQAPPPPPPSRQQQQQMMQQQQQMAQRQQQQQQFEAPEEEAPPAPPKKPQGEPKFLTMSTDEKGILTLRMKRAPVNSMSLEFFRELNEWLLWLGSDEATKAIVITSALPHVYSAGLDITELHKPEPQRFAEFWTQFQENWMMLNTFPKPLIAAINGNSPAGGCILALGCDFRVMVRAPADRPDVPYRIGLNETKLGLIAPPWVMASFSYTIGQRKAERMLQLGETPTADEALAIGLVDEVVEANELEAAAQRAAERFVAVPAEARWMSKDVMRRELFQHMSTQEERQYDTEFFGQMIQNPDIVKNIGAYLERLQKSKKK